MQGLAGCYLRKRQHDKAAKLIRESIEVVPTNMRYAAMQLETDLVNIYITQGGRKLHHAVELARDACKKDPRYSPMVVLYIKALYATRNFDGVLEAVRGFLSMKEEFENEEDAMSQRFIELCAALEEMGRGLRATGSIGLVQPLIERYLKRQFDGDGFSTGPWYAAWLAEFMYQYYDNMDEARELCERILDPSYEQNLRMDYKWAYAYPLNLCLTRMAHIFYLEAMGGHESGKHIEVWADKLKRLSENWDEELPALLLATAYRKFGGVYEEEWRPLLRRRILAELQSLAQQDGVCRWSVEVSASIGRLGNLLMAAGDVENATAAIALRLDAEPPQIMRDLIGSPIQLGVGELFAFVGQ